MQCARTVQALAIRRGSAELPPDAQRRTLMLRLASCSADFQGALFTAPPGHGTLYFCGPAARTACMRQPSRRAAHLTRSDDTRL
jgi:hypothetical protein